MIAEREFQVGEFKLRSEEKERTRPNKIIGRVNSTYEGTETKKTLADLFGELFVCSCSSGCDG